MRTLVLIVGAGLAVPILEVTALVLGIGFVDAFVFLVEGHGRTVDLHTLEPVPIFLITASGFDTPGVLEDETVGTLALVVERVVDFTSLTDGNLITLVDVGESACRTNTSVDSLIPNSTVGAGDSGR